MNFPQGSALHTARSSFLAEHRVKSISRGKWCLSLQGIRNGETEQTSISTYAEGLCKPGEGLETCLTFARAKQGILQKTISEQKNNIYILAAAQICFLTGL